MYMYKSMFMWNHDLEKGDLLAPQNILSWKGTKRIIDSSFLYNYVKAYIAIWEVSKLIYRSY